MKSEGTIFKNLLLCSNIMKTILTTLFKTESMLSKVNRSSQLEGVTNNEGGCNVGGDVVREGAVERGGAGDKIDDSLSFSLSCFKYKHTLLLIHDRQRIIFPNMLF